MVLGPERHVVMSQHDEDGPMTRDYTLRDESDEETDEYHHATPVEDPSQLPDDAIWLVYHKFEPRTHQLYREQLGRDKLAGAASGRGYCAIDATYSSANHFDALAPKKLGKCPESPPAWCLEPVDRNSLSTSFSATKQTAKRRREQTDNTFAALMDAVDLTNDFTGETSGSDKRSRRVSKRSRNGEALGLETSKVDEAQKRENAIVKLNGSKLRLIQQLRMTAGYLAPVGSLPNTLWHKFLRESKMLGDNEEDFFLRDNFLSSKTASQYTQLAKSLFTNNEFVNWGVSPALADRIGKITIHVEGYTRPHLAAWDGEDDKRLTDAEKAALRGKVLSVAQDSAIGKAIMTLCISGKDIIPASFLDQMAPASKDEPDSDPLFPWDVQLNASIGCTPHHKDDEKHDGPGGAVIPVNVNKGAVVVFGKFTQELTEEGDGNPPMNNRYLAPASAYGFAGEKLTMWDHGIYPTDFDSSIKVLVDAIANDSARFVYTLRYGNTAEHVRQEFTKWDESGSAIRCYVRIPPANDKDSVKDVPAKTPAATVPSKTPVKEKQKSMSVSDAEKKLAKRAKQDPKSQSPPLAVREVPMGKKQMQPHVPGGVPRGWSSNGADLTRSYPGSEGFVAVEHNGLQQQKGSTMGMLLQRGVAVSVLEKSGNQLQVCILGVFVVIDQDANKRAYALIAVREELPTPLSWGTPMWSGLARLAGPKCEGCPWRTLQPAEVPGWNSDDMDAAAKYGNFKESGAALKLWDSVVQYEARVNVPEPLHPLTNMSSKPADKPSRSESQSQSPPPPPAQEESRSANTGRRNRNKTPDSQLSLALGQWQDDRSAQGVAGLQAGSVYVNVPPNPPQPPLGELVASISSSIAETWKTAGAAYASANAATASTQQADAATAHHTMMLFAQSQEKRANEASQRADLAIKTSQVLAKTILANQSAQIGGLQATMAAALMASIGGAGGAGGHAAASFAQPQAQLGAPAQPQSTEAGIASWLKSKGIAHDDEILEELIQQGVEVGEDVLLMSEEDWARCGFKPVALMKLTKEKERSV
jgi:hypothetical protein